MSPLTEPTRLVLRKGWQPMDSNAATYIAAVEAADGQALEEKTKIAIDNFVIGCKQDGIWNAIKASCILAGARTLAGALVPLVGAAPTNFNFVSGDYNRKTGLVGDGSTKYLNSNRNNNVEPQNSKHISCYISTLGTGIPISTEDTGDNGTTAIYPGSPNQYRNNALTLGAQTGVGQTAGFFGNSRAEALQFTVRNAATTTALSVTSQTPINATFLIFRRGAALPGYGTHRLAFYSIGESLDLAKLDARVTDLINAFGAAIP